MSKTNSEKAAELVLANMGARTQRAFDPTMLIPIAEIVIELIAKCRENRSAKEFQDSAAAPSFREELAVRRHVRRYLSFREFHSYGEDLIASMLDSSKNLTEDEWKGLIAEAD